MNIFKNESLRQKLKRFVPFKVLIRNIRLLFRYPLPKETVIGVEDAVSLAKIVSFWARESPDEISKPRILNLMESLRYIRDNRISVCRFGDGEFAIAHKGIQCGFQRYDARLRSRLNEVLSSSDPRISIGLLRGYFYYDIDAKPHMIHFYLKNGSEHVSWLLAQLNQNQTFLSAEITLAGSAYNNLDMDEYFRTMREIWQDRDITIVSGAGVLKKLTHDIYSNVKSVEYIEAPSQSAFDDYDNILAKCVEQPKDRLFILVLGPTATVLAYDLAKAGYQALDFGHAAKDYHFHMSGQHSNSTICDFFAPD